MSSNKNIVALGVSGLARKFREGSLSPVTATEFYLSQIAILNPKINAVLDIYAPEAHKAAQASALRYKAGKPLSDIDGVPVGVKANIAVNGQFCHAGIKAYENVRAKKDAQVVSRLKKSGAVIIGSLNMEEGALGAATDNPWFGKTFNPLKAGYTPGGSSGGSAAAVAAGMMPAALGTDTMGSVRIPSAYCGLVGHKPTYGLVAMNGVIPLSPTLDHVGPHTRTAEDAMQMMNAISGQNVSGLDVDLSGLSVGILDWTGQVDVEPGVRKGFDAVVAGLKTAGAKTQSVSLRDYDFGQVRRAGLLVSEIEGAKIHTPRYEKKPEGFSEAFQSLMTWGVLQNKQKVEAAYARIAAQKARAATIFKTCKVLIAPTAPQRAFKFGDPVPANQADFTAFANFAGLPATAIPVSLGKNQLPASVQIVGPRGSDALTLAVADRLSKLI